MASALSNVYVVGSFTIDPIVEVLRFWSERIGLGSGLEAAPYGQLFQQLLDPASGVRSNRAGATMVFVRWRDLVPAGIVDAAPAAYVAAADELAGALAGFAHAVPCLVVVAPQVEEAVAAEAATERLEQLTGDTAKLFLIRGEQALASYRVDDPYDPVADRSGHIPYRDDAMAALATVAMRWYAALVRKPVKVVAADCDNTLWGGVVGEDGRAGLRIEDGHLALQRRLIEQGELGRLVCLVSKNEEPDVVDVLVNRPDMALRRDHVLALAANWQPKPDNIERLAADFDFATDSVLFLDDNPVECETMRRQCPSVLTVRTPEDHRQLASFADHLWLFDQPRVTKEDRLRVQMYRDNVARLDLKRASQDIDSFIAGLGLEIEISVAGTADVSRLAQLTQRTNQFNCSLLRCDEDSLQRQLGDPAVHLLTVRVRDRFGDYGLVGMMRGREHGQTLVVDLFMLSCRALGRGVEHRMANHLGALALRRGLAEVAIEFVGGERNTPARHFVEDLVGQPVVADGRHRAGSRVAAEFRFATASLARRAETASSANAAGDTTARPAASRRTDWGRLYEDIAWNLDTAAKIVAAMAERRERPNLATGYVAPAPGLERQIADVWSSVLGVSPVGANDRFQDLGGRSLHVIRIHSRLVGKLGLAVELSELFQHATVSILATHIASRGGTGNVVLQRASDRANLMRQAQAKAASRFKGKQ